MAEIGNEIDFTYELRLVRRAEDQLAAVIRAHLLVEYVLSELMNAKSVKGDWSEEVLGGRFGYIEKLRIAVSFGLLDRDLWKPLLALGQLRNKFAHKISYFIGEDEQKEFLDAIPSKYRRQTGNFLSEEENEDEQPEPEGTNIVHLQASKGRRAMSWQFFTGLMVLLTVLVQILEDVSIEPTDPTEPPPRRAY